MLFPFKKICVKPGTVLFETMLSRDPLYFNFTFPIPKYAILQKLNGDKIDVAEQITCYQIAHTPSVIQMDHLVPNKLVHAVLNTVIVEVLQLIVNVPTVLIIEKVRLSKISYVPRKVKSMNLFLIHLLQLHHKSLMA